MVLWYIEHAPIEHQVGSNTDKYQDWLSNRSYSENDIHQLKKERDELNASEISALSESQRLKFREWGISLHLKRSLSAIVSDDDEFDDL